MVVHICIHLKIHVYVLSLAGLKPVWKSLQVILIDETDVAAGRCIISDNNSTFFSTVAVSNYIVQLYCP